MARERPWTGGADDGDRRPSDFAWQTERRAAVDALRRLLRRARLHDRAIAEESPLTAAQLCVLEELAEASADSVRELADRLQTCQRTTSTVVTSLALRSLVCRKLDASDGRRFQLHITPLGRRALVRGPGSARARLLASLAEFPSHEVAQLTRTLTQWAATLPEPERPD